MVIATGFVPPFMLVLNLPPEIVFGTTFAILVGVLPLLGSLLGIGMKSSSQGSRKAASSPTIELLPSGEF